MLSIAIYSKNKNDTELLRSKIQDFLLENKTLAKILQFDNEETFITVPDTFDLYFIDIDDNENAYKSGEEMMAIDNKSFFIYFSSNKEDAYNCFKIRADYFLKKPIDPEDVYEILKDIKTKIKNDAIIIKTAAGERRVFINQLNYVNIIRRCLCYHLIEGGAFDGQTLRGSFEKAIHPLEEHPMLVFLPPSLLINISNVKILNGDNLIFDNDEQIYFPKKSHSLIECRWKKYNEI